MAQVPIVSYKKILPEAFQNVSKDKIIIKLDDLKAIPELSKYISITQIVKSRETKLVDYEYNIQNEIIKIFLKNYDFLQFKSGEFYFNFTKLQKYFPNNVFYSQLFNDIEPDIVVYKNIEFNKNNSNYLSKEKLNELCEKYNCIKYYNINKLSKEIINYIGILFFTAFYKVENFNEFTKIEYDNFTDINFEFNDFNMITDMKEFFLTQLLTFLKTNNGTFFGSSDFGSNVKYYVQTKFLNEIYEKIYHDIKGFISDLNTLYNNFLDIIDIKILTDDYKLEIFIHVSINNENLAYRLVVEN